MGNVFGKSKKKQNSRVTDSDWAILELKNARDQLNRYKKKIEGDLEKERTVAKTLLQEGRNDRAKAVLRKKRYKESLIEKTERQLENLDTMVNEIEMTNVQIKVVDGIKAGKEALAKLQNVLKLDDVEQLMDDTDDAVKLQQQIVDTLAGSMSPEDEQEALDELEALLAADDVAAQQGAVGISNGAVGDNDEMLHLPDVPTGNLPVPSAEVSKSAAGSSYRRTEAIPG